MRNLNNLAWEILEIKKGSNCSEFYNGIEGSTNLVVGVHQEPPEGAVSRDGWLLHFCLKYQLHVLFSLGKLRNY